MDLIHHHFIFQGKVGIENIDCSSENILKNFLHDLVSEIDMEVLIDPVLAYSEFDAWTGMIGIVTSHITFHYWTKEQYLQLDIYSCKKFKPAKVVNFLKAFWLSSEEKVLFIDRESGKDFEVMKIS